MGDPNAQLLDLREDGDSFVRLLQQHPFGDLDFELTRFDTGFVQREADRFGEVSVAELDRRDIDGKFQARPGARLTAGLADHPFSDRENQPGFLSQRNELIRCDKTFSRIIPAQERLDPDDLLGCQVDLRLVVQLELAFGQRPAQTFLQSLACPELRIHLLLEELERAAPAFFTS